MLRLPPMATLVATLALAAPAAAQTRDSIEALTPGRRAYSFMARSAEYGAAGAVGIWRVVAPDRSRGWVLDLSGNASRSAARDSTGSSTSWDAGVSVDVGPRFRRYLAVSAPIAPFFESGLSVGFSYVTGGGAVQPTHRWSPSLGASLGAGAEWFPLRRVGLAAQTGLQGRVAYAHESVPGGGVFAGKADLWTGSLQTFVSALTLQLYF